MPGEARHGEAGIAHAERTADASLDHFAKRRPLDASEQHAEQIGGVAVVEGGAGMGDEWQRRERGNPFVWRERRIDVSPERLGMSGGNRTGPEVPIRESRAMRQQVAEGNRPRRRFRIVQRAGRGSQDAHGRELRGPPGNRLIKGEPALFPQRHRRHRGDRLRHRRDAEDRVALHRQSGLSRSRTPTAEACTTWPPRHTRVTAPARSPRSTSRCMAWTTAGSAGV